MAKYTKKSLAKLLNLCIVPNTARLGAQAIVGGRRKLKDPWIFFQESFGIIGWEVHLLPSPCRNRG